VQQEIRWPTGGIAAADLRQAPFLAAKVIFRCPSRLEAATDWLAVREADLLPVGYFHVVSHCRRLAAQCDPVIADDINALGWVLLIGPGGRGRW